MDRPDTLIENNRRRTFQFVVAVILITNCCLQVRAQEAFVANTYTVIGDVLHPSTHPWPVGQRVSIQMALRQAGFDGPSGTAVVRTANQPDRIIPGSAYTNSSNPVFLKPGDTVVWRSIEGSRLQSGNIAILTDHGPRLEAIPIKGVDLGTLRQTARLPFDQPVVAHRNSWGNEHSFPMQSNAVYVKHGDVLDARTVTTRGTETRQTAMMQQAISQPAATTVVGSQPERRSELGIVRPVSHPMQSQNQSQVRVQNSPSGLRVPPVPQLPQTADTSQFAIPAALPNASNTLRIPNTALNQTDGLNSFEEASDSNLAFFESVESSAQPNSNRSATSTTASDQLGSEAINPNESGSEDTAQSFLSGVFLFGLVLAIGLITVGIVRTRQEQRLVQQSHIVTTAQPSSNIHKNSVMEQQQPAAAPDSIQHSTASDVDVELENCPVLSVGLKESEAVAEQAKEIDLFQVPHEGMQNSETTHCEVSEGEVSEGEVSESQSAATHVSAHTAVDLTAWLTDETSDDDLENSQASTTAELTAGETAADVKDLDLDSAVKEVFRPAETLQLQDVEASSLRDANSDDLILELPDVDAVRTALAITEQTATPARFAANHESGVTEAVTSADQLDLADTSIETDAIDSQQTIQDQEDIMAHPPMTQAEAQYLEDLIQNRLPMELSETQLPLRINLFGKPEGPRRLRIDAAHSAIAPPHMASSASRAKRREPAMALRDDAAKSTAKQSAQHQPTSSSDISKNSQTTVDSSAADSQIQNSPAAHSATQSQSQVASQNPTSGLDKALNFLEEQSKS